ncbi:hypothetical protein DRE_05199 [Drechslerella stenobrocha 248]|uniref:F-box domain-containing protein n=1 Tax=Drechslerella stenobrocha 248 TaxID=1043628 RepID=W7I0B2_9PEZI|nr:hypothetical protein DRE_05199 [Drechslerella stenobrocha 248]
MANRKRKTALVPFRRRTSKRTAALVRTVHSRKRETAIVRTVHSRKRETAIVPTTKASRGRLKTLRSRPREGYDDFCPFLGLPSELQLRILSYCNFKTLVTVSLVSNHLRDISLHLIWETQPVDCISRNMKQLDEHEDLRPAVRHLAVRKNTAPSASRMLAVAKRLAVRFPKDYFSALKEFSIDYHGGQSDHFIQIINTLAKHQPRNFKTLNIGALYKWSKLDDEDKNVVDKYHANITYPSGLTTIRITSGFNRRTYKYDLTKAFDASADTLTTAELHIGCWWPHLSMKQCPKVTTLSVRQEEYDIPVAPQMAIRFPNVEKLVLNAPRCGGFWPPHMMEASLERYQQWEVMSSVKHVTLINEGAGMDHFTWRDAAAKGLKHIVTKWVTKGRMRNLERVECFSDPYDYYRERREGRYRSFVFVVKRDAGVPVVKCQMAAHLSKEEGRRIVEYDYDTPEANGTGAGDGMVLDQ